MKFGNVETNIETVDQYESIIRRIIEWYCNLKHPDYKAVEVKQIERRNKDV